MLVRDRERLVQDGEPFLELVARDRQRRAEHDDVPVRHQEEAAPECRVIENANARLSCYDAAHPPKMEKSAVPEKEPSRADYKDPFIAEDARTSAKLKNICRGC